MEIINDVEVPVLRIADMNDAGMQRLTDKNYSWFKKLMSTTRRIIYRNSDITNIDESPSTLDDDSDNEADEDLIFLDLFFLEDDISGFEAVGDEECVNHY